MNLRIATACLALSLAGCAALHWQKADADPARTAKDLNECQQHAMLAVRRLGGAMSSPSPVIVGSPSGPVSVVMPSANPAHDPAAQQSLISQCMRERGYRLVREDGK